MRNLLVGHDGSPASMRALEWAAIEAEVRGFGLTVVQSWTDAIAGGPSWIDQLGDPRGAEWRAKLELDRAVDAVAGRHPSLTIGSRVVGDAPRDALLRAADDADMVVVG